jgi:peptidoglycan/xylan/chitin deacetylase (PgdA/CDA1 family)
MYLVKTPWLLKKTAPNRLWNMPAGEKKIYLTFDDGPHPEATVFVLDELEKYHAKATFFCIGNNVAAYPQLYKRILEEGHRAGNHTNNHLNGWKVDDEKYFRDIQDAAKYIDTDLFRPPYGRITRFQAAALSRSKHNFKIVMWDVLSGDFDKNITPQQCTSNVIKNTIDGSIVVFHDSEKAYERMREALKRTLDHFAGQGYTFVSL